jgi:protein phosphatase
MSVIAYACVTDRGRTHRWNEDRWFADPVSGLFLVTDGMAEEKPAQLVVDLLPEMLRRNLDGATNLSSQEQNVRAAIAELSRRVHDAALAEPGAPWLGVGATIALVVVRWPVALIAHLGDSRVYLHRDGRLQPLTRDHSFVEQLVSLGRLDREAANRRKFNGGPTRFAGMADEAVAETRLLDLRADDSLLLCTDGLVCMLNDARMEDLLNAHADFDAACHALVDAANEAGGVDNITVLLVGARSEPQSMQP